MGTQTEAVAAAALVGGAETGLHTHPGGGGSSTPDRSYFRKVGTTTYEAWYTSPNTGTALTATAVTLGRLYAIPFISSKAGTLDRIAFNVTTLLAGFGRAGIYSDTGSIYPGARLLDGGEISTSTAGVKSATINQALSGGTLYWLTFLASVAVTVRCFAVGSLVPVLGFSNALGTAPNVGLYAAQAYGALPATFPATPTMIVAAPIPAIFVRYSA
jgi:hypothetical protein